MVEWISAILRSNFAQILFGWFLGILSSLAVDRIKRPFHRADLRKSLSVELVELRYRLAAVAYYLRSGSGEISKDFISWLAGIVNDYHGPNESEKLNEALNRLINLDDAQLAPLNTQRRPDDQGTLMKKLAVPLLDSQMGSLSLLSPQMQHRLLDMRANLDALNEDVEATWYWFQKTFDSSLDDVNRHTVEDNLKKAYSNAAKVAEKTARKITTILAEL